jgi:hypothetical protein
MRHVQDEVRDLGPRERAPLGPLFLVSLVAVGFEISLTRYFAVASWSEYGYWVISIALMGFAVSGVVLSLFRDPLARHHRTLLLWAPAAMLLAGTIGFALVTRNPFNPLELQNPQLWRSQLWNVGAYYLALFPFFFSAGVYVGLYFVTYQEEIPRAYGADLAGAGTGGLIALALMFLLHPFHLLAALLPLLVLGSYLYGRAAGLTRPFRTLLPMLVLLCAAEYVVAAMSHAGFSEYKSIFAPLHVPGARVVEERRSPRGLFTVLDDFTERLDTDFSNNAAALGIPEPPLTLGLYSDGNRLTSLPRSAIPDARYVSGALDAFPYLIRPGARTLLIGTRGGFRIPEALSLGAGRVLALEPDPDIYEFVRRRNASPDARVEWSRHGPAVIARTRPGAFDIVDIASDFLGQTDANRYVFTVEGVQALLGALNRDGVLSIPVSIRELTVYATKMLRTTRQAMRRSGIHAPETHIAVYRSAWNARILVFRQPIRADQVAALRTFCDDRSFDLSYYAGIRPDQARIWNDLPAVSFEDATVISTGGKPSDAVMSEALRVLGASSGSEPRFFDTRPSTYDRPFFWSVLRLGDLRAILRRIDLVPREEIASLVNLAVLAQAAILALIVLGLPLIRWRATLPPPGFVVRSILYFAALGLGYLFLEILLIEKVALLLNDRTVAFAMVVTTMLFFSGLGSLRSAGYSGTPRRGVLRAGAAACLWIALLLVCLDRVVLAALAWTLVARIGLAVLIVAPLAVALGYPFPLGLTVFQGPRRHFLPWAWSLNGAFSVISTPLANLLALSSGYRVLLLAALVLYASTLGTCPAERVQGGVN